MSSSDTARRNRPRRRSMPDMRSPLGPWHNEHSAVYSFKPAWISLVEYWWSCCPADAERAATVSSRPAANNRHFRLRVARMVVLWAFPGETAARLYGRLPVCNQNCWQVQRFAGPNPAMRQFLQLWHFMVYNSAVICRFGATSATHSFRRGSGQTSDGPSIACLCRFARPAAHVKIAQPVA